MVIKSMTFLFLLTEAIEDIKFRALRLNKLIFWGMAAVIIKYLLLGENVEMLFVEIIVGVLVLTVCRITNEAMGYGDGAVILVMSVICGIQQTLISCMLSFGVFLVAATVIMFRKGFKRNLSLPFVPCLFFGYIGGLLI